MKYILLIVLLTGITVFAQKKLPKQIIITGTISGDTKGYNKVYCYGTGVSTDSAKIVNGTFKFILPFKEPVIPLFYTEYDVKIKKAYQPFAVLIDRPGQVKITAKNIEDGLNQSVVTGLRSAESFQLFNNAQKDVYAQISIALKEKFGKSWAQEDDSDYKKLNESRDSLTHSLYRPFVLKYVKEHPDSYTSVIALLNASQALTIPELEDSYKMLAGEIKISKHGKSLENYIIGIKKSMPGRVVENFSLPDATARTFAFNQLRGKFVVLDFWASWCHPCRRSFPHMREVYKKYAGKNIEFVGVSIDEKKEDWTKAMNEENNPWPQLFDSIDMHEKMFGISAIPTTFLIGPDGKIILKEIGFSSKDSEMESKLKEIFGE